MTTPYGPQGSQPQYPYNPQPQQVPPWATGRHSAGPQQPPHGQPAWTPAPPEPPRKKGGKWKWVVGVLAVLLVIGMVNGAGDESADTATAAAPVAEDAVAPEPVAPPAQVEPPAAPAPALVPEPAAAPEPAYDGYGATSAKYGDTVTAGDMEVTVNEPKTRSQQYLGDQVCAKVSYRNVGSSAEPFNMFDWKFRTSNGVETTVSAPFNAAGKALTGGDLAPGGTVAGEVCGDLDTTNVTSIVYNPGFGIMHEVEFTG